MVSYPTNYGYVLAVASSTGLLNMWHSVLVSGARKAAGIKYPALYASNELAEKDVKANKFNCTQRAHGNMLEELPWFLFALLFTGLEHPKFAAGAGIFWIVGRVIYTLGYISGDPKKRGPGSLVHHIGSLGLLGGSLYSAYSVIKAGL